MNTLPIIAAITSSSLVNALVWVLVAGVIFGLLHWLINYIKPDEPFNKVARVLLAIVAVVFLINALLTLVGRGFITF